MARLDGPLGRASDSQCGNGRTTGQRNPTSDKTALCNIVTADFLQGDDIAEATASAGERLLRGSEFRFSEAYLNLIRGGSERQPLEPTDPVSDPVDQVLRALTEGLVARSAIQARLRLKHRPTFRANYLYPALARELIEMTIPGKPSSRLQQYRLTAAGQVRVQALVYDTFALKGGTAINFL